MKKNSESMSNKLITYIEEWKEKPGNLIMVLHRVQEEYGYVPKTVAFEIARILNIPLAKIYGVLTFYHFFKLEKPGKHKLQVCMGTACYLKGASGLVSELENLLDINVGESTADGRFLVEAVRCVGCCGLAPVLVADGEVYGNIVPEKLPAMLVKTEE